MWSDASQILHDGKLIPLFHWCSDPIKDVLHKLRSGNGAEWLVAGDAGAEYERQLNGEHKKERVNKTTGKPEWRWVRRHANHAFDCEAMQVTAALMLGILVPPEAEKDVETEAKPPQ
jgi:asparagine synthetase B (glutamine-hydrolysing)